MEHNKKKFDAVIIGGGPSGCTAAFNLKKSGLNVLILDKAEFPRHKPCAGGITMKTLKHLPVNIDHLVEHTAKKMVFDFGGSKRVGLSHNIGSCVMVIRDEFDNYFFNETLKIGVKFRKINQIKNIQSSSTITIEVDNDQIECKYLIGADGANSVVRKLTSSLKYKNPVFAYEGKVPKNKTNIQTEFIFNKYGYAWIFPKKDHYNVGIGRLVPSPDNKKLSKKELFDFVSKRFNDENVDNITAYPIGTEGQEYQAVNNIFLVGDAAGFAESLLGEGIYNAVLSGKYAAKSIISSLYNKKSTAVENYNSFLSDLKNELQIYQKGSKILYGFPRISYWMMRLGLGKKFMNGYSEGKTLTEIMGKSNIFAN